MAWALDLDGVVWLGDHPDPGRGRGHRPAPRRGGAGGVRDQQLLRSSGRRGAPSSTSHGIDPGDDVVTSAVVAAGLVQPGERALVCGGPGIVEELGPRRSRSSTPARPRPPTGRFDVVVVGYHPTFDYHRMDTASAGGTRRGPPARHQRRRAPIPWPRASSPGVAPSSPSDRHGASGVTPEVAGKPHEPAAVARAATASVPTGSWSGDRPDTDGRFAVALGYRFGLVLSGVTSAADLPTDPPGRPRRRRPGHPGGRRPRAGERPAAPRRRAGAAGPGAEPRAGPGRHRRRPGDGRRGAGHQGRPAGRPGRGGRGARPAAALRQPGRRQARGRGRALRPAPCSTAPACSTAAPPPAASPTAPLQHGAAEVVAVDVGHNQLHERLRADPRVRNIERTNLRTLDPTPSSASRSTWWSPTCRSSRCELVLEPVLRAWPCPVPSTPCW